MNFDTEIGGAGRAFPRTTWALVRSNRDPQALERLVSEYWKPVYCLIRRTWGKSNEEAKDLTQEFFATAVLDGTVLKNFSPDRGSFRAFLKGAISNFMRDAAKFAHSQKRGGRVKTISEFDVSELVPDTRSPEEAFDVAWRNVVLNQAVGRLKERVKPEVFEVFRKYDLDPQRESYQAVGRPLGLSADTVKNYLTKARAELRRLVAEIVSDYVDNQADLSIELQDIYGAPPA
jgi:RNA polymerase sigma factor (sigma-70 family)